MNLERYTKPIAMSDPGLHAALFEILPHDADALARIVQGLLIHQHLAHAYGVSLNRDREAQSHIRPIAKILSDIVTLDPRPLFLARAPDKRLVGVCRHFTLLHVAMLRSQNIPARARCGFGAYFEQDKFLDHWVTEYWNEAEQRWKLTDPQIDHRQRELFAITLDLTDIPRDKFIVAGDAWLLCRQGKANPDAFGILDKRGLWFVAGNVIRDIAALNNREMLPWDVWGAMRRQNSELNIALFDRLAILSREPDIDADKLSAASNDERVGVPKTVYNAVLNCLQDVAY